MTVLLSGSTGFLGSHLLKKFVKEGFEVIALKRSSSDMYRLKGFEDKVLLYDIDDMDMKEIFQKHHIDIVLNTVTDYGRGDSSISDMLESNLLFGVRLLENATKNRIRTFINTDTLLDKDINAYALSKNQLLQWMQFLSSETQRINIKIEHMYGPLDDEKKFIYWVIKQLKDNVEKIDLTTGVQKRDFIYIDDIVTAYMAIINSLDKFSSFEEFELGSGESVEVKEVLNLIYGQVKHKQDVQTKLNFGAVAYREKENMNMKVDISKLHALGWKAKVKLKDGIKKIVDGEIDDTTRTA